eukprot:89779_1
MARKPLISPVLLMKHASKSHVGTKRSLNKVFEKKEKEEDLLQDAIMNFENIDINGKTRKSLKKKPCSTPQRKKRKLSICFDGKIIFKQKELRETPLVGKILSKNVKNKTKRRRPTRRKLSLKPLPNFNNMSKRRKPSRRRSTTRRKIKW